MSAGDSNTALQGFRFGFQRSPSPFPRHALSGRRSYLNQSFRGETTANVTVGTTIAACVGVYVYKEYASEQLRKLHNVTPIQFVLRNLVGSVQNLQQGRYWTLLTYTFTHFGVGHLALNMVGLWSFGRLIVRLYGVPSFVALWIGSGVSGALATLIARCDQQGQQARLIGASGSVLGMSAAFSCQFPRAKSYFLLIVSDLKML